ncbi:E3 ubiquitin-protein ligase IPI1 [Arachis hypogaea]|uniref:E3 ubiquitin-protein ligase IPI1 n=1 Tax=Arachis hypogaea TaxID=3818 RepID=UPI000DEC9FE1|nr:E3 ubiquitin-protein ligase RFI2 [Arachis hypogaea]
MGLGMKYDEESKVVDDGGEGGGGGANSFDSVSCSICLDAVIDNGDRSLAKLKCGHQFHLDCIGSAFNMKGTMQCPNCRKIEKGQWLYANGGRSYHDYSMDDWTHDEDLYDLSYSEMSFGVHWCPFGNLARLPSSFEDGEFSSSAYHDILEGQHAVYAEHHNTVVNSVNHPCPYVAYFGAIHPSSSNSGGNVSEISTFSHWNGSSVHSDMPTSYTYPTLDLHYHSWEQHSPPFSTYSSRLVAGDRRSISPRTQRPSRGGSEVPRSSSYMHPPGGHSSSGSVSSVTSSMLPPYPGSNARSRDSVQALQAYYQSPMRTHVPSGSRRSGNHSGSPQIAPFSTSPDQSGFFFVPSSSSGRSSFPEDACLPSRYHAWEREHISSLSIVDRDSGWRQYHQTVGRSERSSNYRLRRASERMHSHNR